MMKSKHLLASLFIAISIISAKAEVGLLVEYIELSEKDATRLLLKNSSPIELRAEVAASEAKVIDVAYLRRPVLSHAQVTGLAKTTYSNRRDGRGLTESVLEYIYPTEWDQADIVPHIKVDVTADMDLKVPPNPTAYDVRNIGNQLEFSALRDGDGELLLGISTNLVYLEKLQKYGDGDEEVEQPQFDSKNLNVQAIARHGEPILLGLHTPRADAKRDRRVFVFATPFVKHQPEEDKHSPILDLDKRTISVGVDYIEARQSDLAELLSAKSSEVRGLTANLIKNGDASLLASGLVKTTPGQRAKIDPVHEFIYPTEYTAPEIVQKLTRKVLESGKKLKTAAAATAFDVRNLGMYLEAEPELFNATTADEFIQVEVVAELVDLANRLHWGKAEAKSEHPLFRLLSCRTELSIKPGEEALAAILTPRLIDNGKPDGQRRILVIVWADVNRT